MSKSKEIENIKLDLTGCKYIMEMHERIRVAFDFPEWYGANWSAFWDMLREPRNAFVEIVGLDTLPKDLVESGKMIVKTLEKAKNHFKNYTETLPNFECSFDYKVIS